jgi:hypothetical protein
MACNVPILLAGHVEVSDVVRFVAVVGRNGDQLYSQTLVDQEPHDALGGESGLRMVRDGAISSLTVLRGRPRKG